MIYKQVTFKKGSVNMAQLLRNIIYNNTEIDITTLSPQIQQLANIYSRWTEEAKVAEVELFKVQQAIAGLSTQLTELVKKEMAEREATTQEPAQGINLDS